MNRSQTVSFAESIMTRRSGYRNMTYAQLNAAYNNRDSIPDWPTIFDEWIRQGNAAYANRRVYRDIQYGSQSRQRLDIFPALRPHRPTLFYIHGGYWQWNNKEDEAFVVNGPLAHDINVVLCEYRPCPTVRLCEIVADVNAAIDWLAPNLARYGAHPDQLIVGGSSAGAHLAATLLSRPETTAGLLISGIYDLEPIRRSWLNDTLHLDVDEVRDHSPILKLPESAPTVCLAVGSDELPELRRQTCDYYAAWNSHGLRGSLTVLEDRNHFTVMDELSAPEGRLTAELLKLCSAITPSVGGYTFDPAML